VKGQVTFFLQKFNSLRTVNSRVNQIGGIYCLMGGVVK
jgi:hypothetical protein